MKYQELILLKSDKWIHPALLKELGNFLEKRDIDACLFDIEAHYREECKQLILEKGSSYLFSIERFQEAVLPKVEVKDKYLLVEILCNKLKALSPSDSLIIVDSYLFPTNLHDEKDFLQIFGDILESIIHDINRISFVTKPRYNQALLDEVKRLLVGLNPQVSIAHTTTNDFHDRFWIVDESKGLFVGTSLNGIGIRYALIDNIRDEDTKMIVEELKKLRVIA